MDRAEYDGWQRFMARHLVTLYGLTVEDKKKKKKEQSALRSGDEAAHPDQQVLDPVERMKLMAKARS